MYLIRTKEKLGKDREDFPATTELWAEDFEMPVGANPSYLTAHITTKSGKKQDYVIPFWNVVCVIRVDAKTE